MRKFILAGLLSLPLVGCLFSQNLVGTKTSVIVLFPHYYDDNTYPIAKLTPELQKYCRIKNQKYVSWGNYDCDFGANPPHQINLMIALLSRSQIPTENSIGYINNQVDTLPPSAWRTYTINPQQVVEKTKREVPARHPDNIKNYPIGKNGTIIKLTLYIDGNGNITQKIDHIIDIGWVHT